METEILEELGLSKGEVIIYITLLKLGNVKVGQIIEKSKMASSAVHNSLNTLTEKGLISHIRKGKIKFYQAIKPKQLVDFMELKKERLLSIIPELEAKQNISKHKQQAEIFEGHKGVISLLNELIDNTSRGNEYIFFSFNLKNENEEVHEFFSRYDAKRKQKGLVVKGISEKGTEKFFKKRKNLIVKFTNTPIPKGLAICNGKVAIFSWGEKPIGYLIESEQVSDMYKTYFDSMWDISKK